MTGIDKLEVFMETDGPDGNKVYFGIDRHGRLYLNGDPVTTDSRLTLHWLVTTAAVITGSSTLALAIVEIGRAVRWWSF